MSGSTLGGFAGAIVGSFFGMPQLGFMIGSAIGGYVDPVKIQGPRLSDVPQQTGQTGVPIAFGKGTFPTRGNVIWRDKLKEIKKKERQGKGGPEVTSYTYTRSYAVAICQGPIDGILMVKRNGEVVWDARDPQTLEEWMQGALTSDGDPFDAVINYAKRLAAWNSRFASKATFYYGTEDQLPDPTIEAVEGIGNVPPHRGVVYMVVKDDELTDMRGAIPQYEFVVATGTQTIEDLADLDVSYLQALGSDLRDVAWDDANQRFIVVSQASQIYTSDRTGMQWVQESDDQTWAYRAVAVSPTGLAVVSRDFSNVLVNGGGITWSAHSTANANAYLRVLWSQGRFIRAGFTGSAEHSVNGTLWTDSPRPSGKTARHHVVMPGVGAIVMGEDGSLDLTYDGGVTWLTPSVVSDPDPSTNFGAGAWDAINSVLKLYKYNLSTELLHVYTSTNNGAQFTVTSHAGQEYRGGRIFHDGTRFIGLGTVLGTDGYPHVHTSPTGDPPFTKLDVVDGASATNLGQLVAVANSPSVAIMVGNRGLTGFIYRMDLGCGDGIEIPDAPGHYVHEDGTICVETATTITLEAVPLATVVADLCVRAGLESGEYDVSQLTGLVTGYRIATEGGADSFIAPLSQAYFFDAGEWGGKVRFVPRGGPALYSIGPDDLVAQDGDPIKQTAVQELELLRKQTVAYLDPVAMYSPATQVAERRIATIEAKAESSVELPIVATAEFAARVADKRIKVAWGEPVKFEFSVPYRPWAHVTPTDPFILYVRGEPIRARVMRANVDGGRLDIEAQYDLQAAYTSRALGVLPPAPVVKDPALIGPTRYVVMDLPAWREADDALGVYVAASGYLGGWRGAELQFSTDDGATFDEAAQVERAATMGVTTTALSPWVSAEYPSVQTLTVRVNGTLESAASILRYRNRMAVQLETGAWEIFQFATATPNVDGTTTLSGLVRGRYATTPGAVAVGAPVVLLDDAVAFVRAETHLLNVPLQSRAVSYGTDADAAPARDLTITGQSQTEWPPHYVRAVRSGSDVAVSWIGRGRIGAETVARHSQNFTGYRVTFSDGHTADVTTTTYTYASAPDPVTVTVAAINSITGAGPASEAATA